MYLFFYNFHIIIITHIITISKRIIILYYTTNIVYLYFEYDKSINNMIYLQHFIEYIILHFSRTPIT